MIDEILEPINISLAKLFAKGNYSFLVGAGISVEPPSCIPFALKMIESLISHYAPLDEVDKLLETETIRTMRFETIVETIQDLLDKELKFLDYFDHITLPNIIHYFLAYNIQQGQFVATTNFDYLIEQALIKICKDKKNIVPVIEKEDFLNYSDPRKVIKTGKFPLYKLHGSKKNIITGLNVSQSLVATLSALGKNRQKGETFAIEYYKKPTLNYLTTNRTLVILGYSGNDDIDIAPALMELNDVNKIIWINHKTTAITSSISEEGTGIEILKVKNYVNKAIENDINKKKIEDLDKLLFKIINSLQRKEILLDVYKINVHTASFIKDYLWSILLKDIQVIDIDDKTKVEQVTFEEWLHKNMYTYNDGKRFEFAWKLFTESLKYDDALRCVGKGISIAKELDDQELICSFLEKIGIDLERNGKLDMAIKMYTAALIRYEKMGDMGGKAWMFNAIGMVYSNQYGIYGQLRSKLALEKFSEALNVKVVPEDLSRKGVYFSNIGEIYHRSGNFNLALENYQKAIDAAEQMGDLERKAMRLYNIGFLYEDKKDYKNAIKFYEESSKIDKAVGCIIRQTKSFHRMGLNYKTLGNSQKALEEFEKAREIYEYSDGNLNDKILNLLEIGIILKEQGHYQEALEIFDETLELKGEGVFPIVEFNAKAWENIKEIKTLIGKN